MAAALEFDGVARMTVFVDEEEVDALRVENFIGARILAT